jgi:arylsulfatase A-like enzyme
LTGARALAVALSCALALALAPGAAAAAPTVILVSLDGVRHDYPDRDALPAFERLAREGARAESLTPPFPSITFVAHTTLSTGTHPDRHGIVSNRFTLPDGAKFEYGTGAEALAAEPLWAAAERQGVRAATFFWPLSEVNWRGTAPTFRRAPFDGELPEREKVAQILAWLDLPETQRPGLIMTWWHGADDAGHRHGPDAEETRAALREQDGELARLLAGIDARAAWREVTLLVVSDHGMRAPSELIDANELLAAAGVEGSAENASALALLRLAPSEDASRAAKQIAAAEPRIRAYARAELPAALRFAHPNAGDVVLLAPPPLAFGDAWSQFAFWRRASALWGGEVGVHGDDAEATPEMRAILFALGRGVPRGAKLGRLRALDVAATVARLLAIAPPAQNEGTPIVGLGTDVARDQTPSDITASASARR